jgi:hypothetical protein
MPKPTGVPPAILEAPKVTPSAANSARGKAASVLRKSGRPPNDKPLQLRLPRAEVKSIKLAAAEREQTISDFMLACFHAYMKAKKA